MDAEEKNDSSLEDAAAPPARGLATVTLTLSAQALDALGAYLRSGAARGQPFEPALRAALGSANGGPDCTGARACPLSARALRKVHEFVEANLGRDIGVADIAAAACVSPHHLGHGYRRATGQTLWQFVLRRRAERARGLIEADPHRTLADVAVLCGFESYGQFIAAFRKTYGVAPGDWRRRCEAAQESA